MTETEILKELYAAINRNDIPAALEFLDPEILRVEPPGFPASGSYRGHAEVEAHWSQARKTWAEGSCEPENFAVSGDKVVAFLHVRVRLKNRADWIDARIADAFVFRNGKITEMRSFAEGEKALEWAGI